MEKVITKTLIESPYPFWLTVLLFSVISGLIQYIIAYYKEKGKNLAQKEDIVEITNKIKETETRFTKQTEQLKSQLSILTNVQSEISTTERNVILDFNKHLFSFIHLIVGGIDNCTNNEALDLYAKKLNDFSIQTANSLPLLTLFIENESLCYKASELFNLALQMESERQVDVINLKMINTEMASINDPNLLEKKNQERINFMNEMFAKPTQICKSNKSLICNFQKECREYIYRLLKKQEA